jgi:uncharacterized protein YbaR (Trm112 family)
MNCAETRTLLSSYLDGAVTGKEMRQAQEHLAACPECKTELALLQRTQQMVAALGRKPAPADLALKCRVAVSHEVAKSRQPIWAGVAVRLENAINLFMVPATAGVLTAIVFIGLLIGFFAPAQLHGDVPTPLSTPPELKFSPYDIGVGINADSVVVEALIDANGRVADYRIISNEKDAEKIRPQLNNMLIFTVFRPATTFGRPTSTWTVLSFSKVNVRG